MMAADCLLLLLQANIIGGITCTWTNIIGTWFYVVMLASLELVIVIKYKNILAPSLLGMVVSLLMITQMPAISVWIHILILAVNIGGVLYGLFIREF